MRCAACGENNPERAKFCLECGAALEQADQRPTAEERKVVTVLFSDLVGFTARSEAADPEDVRATLEPYHRLLRRELERYGGTVEKFIGDAVMAVFGAPVAHEDDAERAIRAALRILEEIELQRASGIDVDVRIGINTGETVVALGARPEYGEAMVAGDVVNTASRIQGIAPVNAIVVAEPTHRLTADLFEFEALDPVEVKGKTNPLSLHRVLAARARFGTDVAEEVSTPFIGREEERSQLESTLRRAIRESSVQSITVVGEPGVGKSRLIRELFVFIDELEELVSWRQGRCLPYGDGITFWALAEVVKAQAGILETDEPRVVTTKLRTAVDAVVEDEGEREWIAARLEPLVGVRLEGIVEQQESFTAWTRFLESVASTGPLVVVIEDLHWADEPLLAYLEHVVEYSRDVPILLVTTARPELFERAPTWGGGRRNVQTLALSALAQGETSLLVSALLEHSVLPAEVHALVLERSGGNPLYAEQFIRMLRDRGLLEKHGRTLVLSSEAEIPFPENVHALIAARLDTLDAERKALLQDAAVVGKVFWSAAIATMSGRAEDEVIRDLHELSRKELVRASRVSTVHGTQEYAFWHVLLRDVAYGQIPRASRAAKHHAAARWIESVATDRVADHAEVLAFHYLEALELARAAGHEDDAAAFVEPAGRFLAIAGNRSLSLDPSRAERHLRRALELIGPGPAAARIRVELAEALQARGKYAEAVSQGNEAAREAEQAGEIQLAGEALTKLSNAVWYVEGRERSMEILERAIELLEQGPPGPALASAYTEMTAALALGGSSGKAVAWANRATELARAHSLQRAIVAALGFRGTAYMNMGDERGISDIEEALALALEHELARDAGLLYNNLGVSRWALQDAASAVETFEQGIDFAERRGQTGAVRFNRQSMMAPLFDLGRWDDLRGIVDVLAPHRGDDLQRSVELDSYTAIVSAYRGEEVKAEIDSALASARHVAQPETTTLALTAAAMFRASGADRQGALAALEELRGMPRDEDHLTYLAVWLGSIARACIACDALPILRSMVPAAPRPSARTSMMYAAATAAIAEASESWDEAIAMYERALEASRTYGSVVEEAHALLGLGRCLVRVDTAEAPVHLAHARDIWSRLGALRLAEEAAAWLAQAQGSDVSEA